MAMKKTYWVEAKRPNGWTKVMFTDGVSLEYARGYVHAIDSCYPSAPHRIMRRVGIDEPEEVQTTPGRGKVHTNNHKSHGCGFRGGDGPCC